MTARSLDYAGGPVRRAIAAGGGLRSASALVREAALIGAATLLYTLVRGLANDRVDAAFDHAEQIIALERSVGLFIEPGIQRAVIDNDLVVDAANAIYIAFWPIVVLTLVWILLRRPVAYPRFRNAVLTSGALSLVLFALYPLAPPRFVPEYGFVDTIALHATTYRTMNTPALVNEYAAMPSLHFGWILLVGIAWVTMARHRTVRALGIALPVLMFASIVLTANHYIVDGIVAGIVVVLGLRVAGVIDRRRSRHDGEPASLQWPQHLEVAAVQRGHPSRPVPLGKDDVRGIGQSDPLVAVALHDPGGAYRVSGIEPRELPGSTADLTEHGHLGGHADPGADEVVEFGENER